METKLGCDIRKRGLIDDRIAPPVPEAKRAMLRKRLPREREALLEREFGVAALFGG
jgi:hypothetical protein